VSLSARLLLSLGNGEVVVDVEEAADLGSADRALVGLHPHDLTAVDTQAHVSAGEHDRVLGRGVADHTLLLALVGEVGGVVVNAVDVVHVEDLVVVEQLLLEVLVLDVVGAVAHELAVGKLNVPPALALVVVGVDGLDRNDHGVEVVVGRLREQVLLTTAQCALGSLVVEGEVDEEELRRDLLL